MSINYRYIRFFREVGIADIPLVGGKNASLGEMYRELTPKGVRVPNGFAITAPAYWYVLEKAGIMAQLRDSACSKSGDGWGARHSTPKHWKWENEARYRRVGLVTQIVMARGMRITKCSLV